MFAGAKGPAWQPLLPITHYCDMEKIENRYIAVSYRLYTVDEGERSLEEEAPASRPFRFITGLGFTIEAFEQAIEPLQEGEKFDFTIPARQAYGAYNDDHVIELPKTKFYIDGKFDSRRIVPDAVIPMVTVDGQQINGCVVEVRQDTVVMDMNHPLAGCDLNFVGEVLENRPATGEEITRTLRMMSGEGGCGGSCGSCGGGCGGGEEGCGGNGGCGGCNA